MEAVYAVEIDVVDLASARVLSGRGFIANAKFVNQIERGARNLFFPGRSQAADDSFGQRCFSAAQVAFQQHQNGWNEVCRDFPAFRNRFFVGMRNDFVSWHFQFPISG